MKRVPSSLDISENEKEHLVPTCMVSLWREKPRALMAPLPALHVLYQGGVRGAGAGPDLLHFSPVHPPACGEAASWPAGEAILAELCPLEGYFEWEKFHPGEA